MTGQDLIDWITESKSEDMVIFLRMKRGALKTAEVFEVRPAIYANDKQELIIVIE